LVLCVICYVDTQPLWCAPEVFKKSKPSKSSDVYSFGIILWEILTRKTPYQGKIKANNNVKTIQQITEGLRPEIPKKCPVKLAELINSCWANDPNKRPNFDQIVAELVELEKEKVNVEQIDSVEVKVEGGEDEKTGNLVSASNILANLAAERKPWMLSSEELKYEAVIGNGSFGEVWLGQFRGKKVAIKKLTQLTQHNLGDFVREVNIMCSLRHPNCVLFMGACLEASQECIVMEFCERGSLFSIIHDVSVPIDYNLILKILMEISEGILYLHLNKPPILHRDLKSLNILLDEHMSVKVSDFGLTDFKPDIPDKAANLQLGNPFWLAPEVMQDGQFTEAADVYSFGMIIWELFTREVPFPSLNPHQAALAVIAEDKRPDIPAFVPPKFSNLIQNCWARNIKQRPNFPDIIETLKELKKEGLPRIELSLSNAALYRKKTTVFAFKSKDTVIVYKPWGTGESKKGDWVLVGPGDDVYTCDAAIFAKTYGLVNPSKLHLYRKTGNIFALEMKRDFLMETLEGMEHGAQGDWIAQNPVDGEQWPIAAKAFAEMYEITRSTNTEEGKQAEEELKENPAIGIRERKKNLV
jgi:serine/threonine protein kinase